MATEPQQYNLPERKEEYITQQQARDLVDSRIQDLGLGSGIIKGTVTRAKYQTHSEAGKGIKIFVNPPDAAQASTEPYLSTTNSEPSSPFNGKQWTNPANAQARDGSYATADQTAENKYQIWKTFTGLQDSIPSGATITGIGVRIKAKVDTGSPKLQVWMSKDGSNPTGAGAARFTQALTTSDSFVSVGGVGEFWNTTWSRSDFGGNFGVMVTGGTVGVSTYSIDYIEVTVFYETDLLDDSGNPIADAFLQFFNKLTNALIYLKNNTTQLVIENASFLLKSPITVSPQESVSADSGAQVPVSNNEPNDTIASLATLGKPWTSPTNAYASDNAYATANQTSEVKFHLFKGFDLLDNIPLGATIVGIQVDAEGKVDAGTSNIVVTLSKDGLTAVGNTDNNTNAWGTTDSVDTIGGAASLWGTTWSRKDFGHQFGVIVFGAATGKTYSLDSLTVTVYYTTTGGNVIDGNINPSVDDIYSIGSSSARIQELNVIQVNEENKYFRRPVDNDLDIGTGDPADVTLCSFGVRGGMLGTSKGVHIKVFFNDISVTGGVTDRQFQIKLVYGSTTLTSPTFELTATVPLKGVVDFYIIANEATNAQHMSMHGVLGTREDETTSAGQLEYRIINKFATATEDSTSYLEASVLFTDNADGEDLTVQTVHAMMQTL